MTIYKIHQPKRTIVGLVTEIRKKISEVDKKHLTNIENQTKPGSLSEEDKSVLSDYTPMTAQSLVDYTDYIMGFLLTAESRSQVRDVIPEKYEDFPLPSKLKKIILKLFNLIFRDQREFNSNLLEAFKNTIKLNQILVNEISSLKVQVGQDFGKLNRKINERGSLIQRFNSLEETFRAQKDEQDLLAQKFVGLEEVLKAQGKLVREIQNFSHFNRDKVDFIDDLLKEEKVLLNIENLSRKHQEQESLSRVLQSKFDEFEKYNNREISLLKNDIIHQKSLISRFSTDMLDRIAQFSRSIPGETALQTQQKEGQDDCQSPNKSLESFYLDFENKFRGSRQLITERLKVYLPLVNSLSSNLSSDLTILDIGCGRGEWLDLLKLEGFSAIGVDINTVLAEDCMARNLEIINADALDYLALADHRSLDVITGFHIIEHLSFDSLVNLFSEVFRVLRPNGMVIFETPNPQNVMVGACDFYLDPTHLKPLPSAMVEFLAQYTGFIDTQVLYLNSLEEKYLEPSSELAQQFNQYFYGPMDYAIVARKP